ncbi:immunity 52 family protein [Ralstonia solanacearum]|uniref:immunity 52 family protein n=1 Tax=Ralstonia solanacearum TaxID=305 RepID=UPI0006966C13|nr:immunity 52 family protein [Ralstonia solanacearum]MDB0543330.1 immunity 52 family protein [Ralstonia solanacearum]MDB0553460.1 immunity 52 family protein [Ralstonia solanacearum]MDB0558309.1 immunity 52 family protein [Ralstonia solanacearum]
MKTPPLNIQFRAQYRGDLEHPQSLEANLGDLFQLRERIRSLAPHMTTWFLGGDSKDESLLYTAFDDTGPTTAVTAVLSEKTKRRQSSGLVSRSIGLWNGKEDVDGANMGLVYFEADRPSLVKLDTSCPALLTFSHALATCQAMVEIWRPRFVSVEPTFYDPVFTDRPGVGWMLYLPQVLTVQQVPEAGALIPVLGEKKKQTGTIIVSVTDEPFSDLNPEHVKLAHRIEVRLVDQDLLPRYSAM